MVRSAGETTYNYENPPQRDVVSVGGDGDNVTIRFTTDNPGPWFLHCHIDWHLEAGFAIVFAEETDEVSASVTPTSKLSLFSFASLRNSLLLLFPSGLGGSLPYLRVGVPERSDQEEAPRSPPQPGWQLLVKSRQRTNVGIANERNHQKSNIAMHLPLSNILKYHFSRSGCIPHRVSTLFRSFRSTHT